MPDVIRIAANQRLRKAVRNCKKAWNWLESLKNERMYHKKNLKSNSRRKMIISKNAERMCRKSQQKQLSQKSKIKDPLWFENWEKLYLYKDQQLLFKIKEIS